jgi:hypothetical protein
VVVAEATGDLGPEAAEAKDEMEGEEAVVAAANTPYVTG